MTDRPEPRPQDPRGDDLASVRRRRFRVLRGRGYTPPSLDQAERELLAVQRAEVARFLRRVIPSLLLEDPRTRHLAARALREHDGLALPTHAQQSGAARGLLQRGRALGLDVATEELAILALGARPSPLALARRAEHLFPSEASRIQLALAELATGAARQALVRLERLRSAGVSRRLAPQFMSVAAAAMALTGLALSGPPRRRSTGRQGIIGARGSGAGSLCVSPISAGGSRCTSSSPRWTRKRRRGFSSTSSRR